VDIAKFFGNVQTFKSNNPLLTREAQKEIETLYWKIKGTSHITNNELMPICEGVDNTWKWTLN
jgi:hypothetical protein